MSADKWKLQSTNLLFLVPQIYKEFRCCGTVPGIVIVAEGKNFQDFGVAHKRFEYLYPILQITSTVNDSLVPCRSLFFNPLAVTKPANITEVSCNQIEFLF